MPTTGRVELLFALHLLREHPASSARHVHEDFWQLEYSARGPILYEVQGQTHRLASSALIAVPPGVAHGVDASGAADSYLLKFHHPRGSRLLPAAVALSLSGQECEQVERIMGRLVEEYDGRSPWRDEMIAALLDELLVMVARWRGSNRALRTRPDANERVRLVADMLRRRYSQRFSVHELAKEACLSRSRFMQLFKEEFGTSPGAFHRRVQMEKAVGLAKYTGMSWQQIAAQLGYEDPSYFSRVFKAVMGRSPSHYR